MPTRNETILIAAVVVMAAVVVVAALYVTWTIHTHGQISTLGLDVYADSGCTLPATTIDWGRIGQGGTSETQLYCKLSGNTPSTLIMSTSNYVPAEAEQFLTLTWDYDVSIVQPGETKMVTLVLHVSQSVFGFEDFWFDITLGAAEVETS